MAFTGRKPLQRRSPGLHGQHNHPERATALSFIWSKHVILQFKFFNTEQQETALFQTEIDLSGLVAVAESKREMIREKGKSFVTVWPTHPSAHRPARTRTGGKQSLARRYTH